ncbi:ArsR/SmtB family transcription factor [Enterovibrio paralichthyis]|uniref:ArsR/SmtB family transcription factor n=1 Tax=Enterovibrio paralichthyis TaxID=2853805 RepID=UPI001C485366|nr:metalloregulator ArsR/SmtB family transcription factor [Enterovibrio paralichthyis]MBV7297424.1 metalloregulator ArsR/SmtB family transcription factor [Enterovibrio paralichthyis]
MVNKNDEQLDLIFSALSDKTRRAMVQQLTLGEKTVRELSAPFTMSKPAVSKHLKVLERAGLLTRSIQGREHMCSLNSKPLAELDKWLSFYESFWTQKLDSLSQFLEEEEDIKPKGKQL